MKRIMYLLLAVLTFNLAGINGAAAGNVKISAKLDSVVLLMGKTTKLHLEIAQDKDAKGFFPLDKRDTINAYVEIAERPKADTLDLQNNRIQINKDYIIQSFDSGAYVLPPIQYIVGKDTFTTNTVSLKVMPVRVDSLKTVHDFKDVESVPRHLVDWMPDFIVDYWWVFLLISLMIVAGLYIYYRMKTRSKDVEVEKEPQLPPFEEAMKNLSDLKERHLWENGQEKEYFTELTDILRNYIDRRFQINAMEMTSSQIISILKKNDEAKAVNSQLKEILDVADFVKFAKLRPMPEDNEASYQRALNFVTETKPVEKPEVTEGDKNADAASVNKQKKEDNNK